MAGRPRGRIVEFRTPEVYQALTEAFMICPGSPGRAAAAVSKKLGRNISNTFARTAYERGWPEPWARPIQELVTERLLELQRERETEERRLRAEKMERQAATEASRAEREQAYREERQGTRAARKGVLAAGVVITQLGPLLGGLSRVAERKLFEVDELGRLDYSRPTAEAKGIKLEQLMRMVREYATASKAIADAQQLILVLGKSDRGGELAGGDAGEEMTVEEARAILGLPLGTVDVQPEVVEARVVSSRQVGSEEPEEGEGEDEEGPEE